MFPSFTFFFSFFHSEFFSFLFAIKFLQLIFWECNRITFSSGWYIINLAKTQIFVCHFLPLPIIITYSSFRLFTFFNGLQLLLFKFFIRFFYHDEYTSYSKTRRTINLNRTKLCYNSTKTIFRNTQPNVQQSEFFLLKARKPDFKQKDVTLRDTLSIIYMDLQLKCTRP